MVSPRLLDVAKAPRNIVYGTSLSCPATEARATRHHYGCLPDFYARPVWADSQFVEGSYDATGSSAQGYSMTRFGNSIQPRLRSVSRNPGIVENPVAR